MTTISCKGESVLKEIFAEDKIEEAMADLSHKRDGCGCDGVMLSELNEYWQINRETVLSAIFSADYEPNMVKEVEIVNYKGKRRTIAIYCSVDRLILKCIAAYLQEKLDSTLTEYCFAFRTGYGLTKAVS